jgi:hypothetical protein
MDREQIQLCSAERGWTGCQVVRHLTYMPLEGGKKKENPQATGKIQIPKQPEVGVRAVGEESRDRRPRKEPKTKVPFLLGAEGANGRIRVGRR